MKDFRIAAIDVKPAIHQLRLHNQTIVIEPLAMKTLVFLAKHQGSVVQRETLLAELWQGKVVSDNALNRIIGQLRKSMGDNAAQPIYIKTIPKAGYMLIANVQGLLDNKIQQKSLKKPTLFGLLTLVLFGTIFGFSKNTPLLWVVENNHQLTSMQGYEEHLAYTPNNQGFLFTHQAPNAIYNDIYLKSLTSSNQHRITDNTLRYDEITFSNSGEQLAFIQHDGFDCSLKIGNISLTHYQLDQEKVLLACPNGSILFPNWSFDDSSIYYSQYDDLRVNRRMYKIDVKSKKITAVFNNITVPVNDSQLTTDSTGQRFAYLRRIGSKQQVRLYNSQTEQDKLIKEFDNQKIVELDWHKPNSLLIRNSIGMFSLSLAGEMVAININGSQLKNAEQIFSNSQGLVAYSQFTYLTKLSEVNNPLMNNISSTKEISPSSNSDYLGYYSPDGSSVVFKSNRESEESRLWLLDDPANNNEATLLPITDYNGRWFFSWSANGKQIVYLNRDRRLTRYNLLNDTSTFLTKSNKEIDRGKMSIDSDKLYFIEFIEGVGQLFEQQLNGTTKKQLTTKGSNYFQESSDGQYLYYNSAFSKGLWRINTTTYAQELVWDNFSQANYNTWQLFDHGVYYKRTTTGDRGVYYYDFLTKNQNNLIVSSHLYYFHVSPDEQTILITQAKEMSGDISIAELVEEY